MPKDWRYLGMIVQIYFAPADSLKASVMSAICVRPIALSNEDFSGWLDQLAKSMGGRARHK
jgi:hypothetical protein